MDGANRRTENNLIIKECQIVVIERLWATVVDVMVTYLLTKGNGGPRNTVFSSYIKNSVSLLSILQFE